MLAFLAHALDWHNLWVESIEDDQRCELDQPSKVIMGARNDFLHNGKVRRTSRFELVILNTITVCNGTQSSGRMDYLTEAPLRPVGRFAGARRVRGRSDLRSWRSLSCSSSSDS